MAEASLDFLLVEPGDIVVVEDCSLMDGLVADDWWLGHVIHVVGGARNPGINSLFQVACVDTGMIRTINADMVKGILRSKDLRP